MVEISFENDPPPHQQMVNATLNVSFLHIKTEVTAATLRKQMQMCRHGYLTASADGTFSEGGGETCRENKKKKHKNDNKTSAI